MAVSVENFARQVTQATFYRDLVTLIFTKPTFLPIVFTHAETERNFVHPATTMHFAKEVLTDGTG